MRPRRPPQFVAHLGLLGLSALALLAMSAAANVANAPSFAPPKPALWGVPVYAVILGVGAACVAVGVWRSSALAKDLAAADARGAARAWIALGFLLGVWDATMTASALMDARDRLRDQPAIVEARAELVVLDDQLARDRAILAAITSAGLADADPVARLQARREAQLALRLNADGDWGPETRLAIEAASARLEGPEGAIAAAVRERAMHQAAVAAAERKAIPDGLIWLVAALAELYAWAVLAGIVRAQPPAGAAARRGGGAADAPAAITKIDGKIDGSHDSARTIAVRGHRRSNADKPIPHYTRKPRGGHAKKEPEAGDESPVVDWGQVRAPLGGKR
jgi:hypothetical protein